MRRRGSGALGRLSLDPPLAVSLLQDSAVPELKGQRGRQVGPPQRSPSIATRAPSDTGLPPSCCRDFVMSSYQELKKANPTFPILIRECSGIEAKMVARYGAPPPPPPVAAAAASLWPAARRCCQCVCAVLRHPWNPSSSPGSGRPCPHTRSMPLLLSPPAALLADFGVEEAVRIEGLGKADISKQLEALVKKGESMPRSTESEGVLA